MNHLSNEDKYHIRKYLRKQQRYEDRLNWTLKTIFTVTGLLTTIYITYGLIIN